MRAIRSRLTYANVIATLALFIALGGASYAAIKLPKNSVGGQQLKRNSVNSAKVKNHSLTAVDFKKGRLPKGEKGPTGRAGKAGANGANGANGTNGTNGTNGVDGTNGANGTNGVDGTIAPLSTTEGLTALPTASPPTPVVTLAVPAGSYVVLAKTELSHTGASDTIECVLKAGTTTVDQIAMKTLPALAAIPVSLQAVAEVTSPSQFSVECQVLVANGSADSSSLIAIPTA